jgi:hypothetical protein
MQNAQYIEQMQKKKNLHYSCDVIMAGINFLLNSWMEGKPARNQKPDTLSILTSSIIAYWFRYYHLTNTRHLLFYKLCKSGLSGVKKKNVKGAKIPNHQVS